MTGDLPTLFSMPGSCALSIQIALRWAGADYQLEVLAPGRNQDPGFLAINPTGQVPAIALGDEPVLTEAHALLLLIADSHPESDLAPPSSQPMARYRLEQLLAFMTGEVHAAFAAAFAPDGFVEGERAASRRVVALLTRLDAKLGARSYILGERTVADAYLYVLAKWGAELDLLSETHDLRRFRAAMETDPAVVATLADHAHS